MTDYSTISNCDETLDHRWGGGGGGAKMVLLL